VQLHGYETPVEILERALHARDQLDFAGMVALCAPQSIERFFHDFCEVVRPMSLDDLRSEHPEIAEEDVPRMLERFRAALGDTEAQLPDSVGVNSYAELCALAPDDFAHRWLERFDPRVRLHNYLRENRAAGEPIAVPLAELYDYDVFETEALGAGRVRVAHRVKRTQEGAQIFGPTAYEQLAFVADLGWRIEFRALLLRPHGVFVDRATPEMVRLYNERGR
jgi:hypothetical protein